MENYVIFRTKEYIELKEKFVQLQTKYEWACRKRKNYFNTKTCQRKRFRKEFLESITQGTKFSDSVGLKIKEVVLVPKETITEDNPYIKIEEKDIENDKKLKLSVYVKDKQNISDVCYQSLLRKVFCREEISLCRQEKALCRKFHRPNWWSEFVDKKSLFTDNKNRPLINI